VVCAGVATVDAAAHPKGLIDGSGLWEAVVLMKLRRLRDGLTLVAAAASVTLAH
jgi:hypothetical protein